MQRARGFLLLAVMLSPVSWAEEGPSSGLNFKAKNYHSSFETHLTQASGDVQVFMDDKTLYCDSIEFNALTGNLVATGHVVFKQGDLELKGSVARFNIGTGLGVFENSTLRTANGVYLEGRELERVDLAKYHIKEGKMSTCQGCPQAWSIVGQEMDIEIEGYGEVHNAIFQIRDVPTAYFPMLIFPVKTKRQSGLLLPQYTMTPDIGSQISLPYFWAIGKDKDTTFEYQYMSKAGNRLWNEYRYRFSDKTYVQGESSYNRNGEIPGVPQDRFGFSIEQRRQVSKHWVQRFRGEFASDKFYTSHYQNDFQNTYLPSLSDEVSLSWQNENNVGYGSAGIRQDNIPRTAGKENPGYGSIHSLPATGFSTTSRSFLGPIKFSSDLSTASFRRKKSRLDMSTNWVRTGDRFTAKGRWSAPMSLWKRFDFAPSLELMGDEYSFDSPGIERSAHRARLFTDNRLSTTFSRVYKTDLSDLRALKHNITPTLRWSAAPPDAKSSHPFFTQSGAPRFDIFDPNAEGLFQVWGPSVMKKG